MCKEIYSRIEYGDKQKAKYDAKGLFLHAVKTYCDEESNRCKKVYVVHFHGFFFLGAKLLLIFKDWLYYILIFSWNYRSWKIWSKLLDVNLHRKEESSLKFTIWSWIGWRPKTLSSLVWAVKSWLCCLRTNKEFRLVDIDTWFKNSILYYIVGR